MSRLQNENERPVRLACGHMGDVAHDCDECEHLGGSPDPWLLAGEDINPNRQAETRSYRQSKWRAQLMEPSHE